MNKIKVILLGISLGLIPNLSYAQNWQALGNGTDHYVISMYGDSTTNNIYIGKESGGSGFNCFNVWNGINWDTLRHVENNVASIVKFHNELILSNNVKWNGSNWVTFPTGGYLYNDNDNYLYCTGWFDSIGGVAASKVAKWNGTNWSAIDTTKWLGGAVACSIVYNGDLYIGGNMWNYSNTIEGVARWDGAQWQPVGNGIRDGLGGVNCFEIYNNELYVGGFFSMANNPGSSIARWDGTNWHDVGGGMTSTNAQIYDMITYNNELYAVGVFTEVGGQPINSIAKWDGTNWCGLGYNAANGNWADALAVLNNELYVGGGFDAINGNTMNYITKWNGGSFTDVCGNTTGLNYIAKENNTLKLYPNPTSQTLTLQTKAKLKTLSIKDITGREVLFIASPDNTIDVSTLNKGLYFILGFDGERMVGAKFVKE